MHLKNISFTVVMLLCLPVYTYGQLQISGDFVFTQRFFDTHSNINTNFRGDDPFNTIRTRLFVRNWLTDDVAVFTEILLDIKAPVRINGAYAVMNNLIQDRMNLKIGLIPSPFGNYGLRSTYFNLNPVIGVPALWHYKTSIEKAAVIVNSAGDLYDANAQILHNREGPYDQYGTPIGYDACWDTGIELNGALGQFDYAVALTNNALSNPTRASRNDGYQGILTLGMRPAAGLRFGVSGAVGAYLTTIEADPDSLFTEEQIESMYNAESYLQRTGGVFIEYLIHRWELFGEWVHSSWDVPGLKEHSLFTQSGYIEARKNVLPAWYIAGRIDYMAFSKIADTRLVSTDQSYGQTVYWDTPFVRIEPGIGWRFRREGMVKAAYQYTVYREQTREHVRILALQLHMVF